MSAAELERLRDRIAELETVLGLTAEHPRVLYPFKDRHFRRGTFDRLLGLLAARKFVPRVAAADALYGDRPECDRPADKCIDVMVHFLRKALKPHGITIDNEFGTGGWFITDENKNKLAALREPLIDVQRGKQGR